MIHPRFRLALLIVLAAAFAGPSIPRAACAQQVTREDRPPVAAADALEARQLFIEGLTLAQVDRPKEALEAYEASLALAPGAPAIFSAMAEAYVAIGEPAMALLYAQQAAGRAPKNTHYRHQVERLRTLQ